MYKSVFLGPFEYLISFLFAYLSAVAGFNVEVGRLVEHDAHILFKVTAALAHYPASASARACGNGDLPRVIYVFAQLIG